MWPLSRSGYPKQFHCFGAEVSLLQQSATRMTGMQNLGTSVFVTNEQYRFLVLEQVQQTGLEELRILLEPVARNSAPALACAAFQISAADPDAVLVVMPADHVILDNEAFRAAVSQAVGLAGASDHFVTFGVVPHYPETGYGYIRAGGPLSSGSARQVDAFREKPDLETAQGYLNDGCHFWNSGIFVVSARRYLAEVERLSPGMYTHCQRAVRDAVRDLDFLRLDRDAFIGCPADSIDYAILEHIGNIAVIPIDVGWDDVGSWASLARYRKDPAGNSLYGDVQALDSRNTMLYSTGRLMTAIGVENLIAVETPDAVLVAHKDAAQEVRQAVDELKQQGRPEADLHTTVYRPWGHYETLHASETCQVKRLFIRPGQMLSLQRHRQRSEHWVVTSGTARVTLDDREFDLPENQSVYVPMGSRHRLANRTADELVLIEVQTGSYFGEDDIERFEDIYGRNHG